MRGEGLPLRAVEFQTQPVICIADAHHLGAEFEIEPRTRKHPLQRSAELTIHIRHNMIENLDDGHLGAEPLPNRPELEADITAADDREPLRHVAERQCAGRGYNAFLIDLDPGQRGAFRACGYDDGSRLDLRGGPIRTGYC